MSNRRAPGIPRHRLSVIVLAVGGILALAAALGPVWAVRAGVCLAVLAGVAALVLAHRAHQAAARTERAEHGRELVAAARSQRAALSADRAHHRQVLDTLDRRQDEARATVIGLRAQVAELSTTLATSRGDRAALEARLAERDATLARLRQDLAARAAELRDLSGTGAELLALPRRVLTDADWERLPTADDLWGDGEHPTVVDLDVLRVTPAAPRPSERAV